MAEAFDARSLGDRQKRIFRLDGAGVHEGEDILGLPVRRFVDTYVRSLLTWDVLVFFHRNDDVVLDVDGLGDRLGRHPDELQPEIERLCRDRIVVCTGGLISYEPEPALRGAVGAFVEATQERRHRLALIAAVLQKIAESSD